MCTPQRPAGKRSKWLTNMTFETYSEKYRWLEKSIFVCYGVRLLDKVLLRFFEVK
jgi:hypothetical protein